VFLNLHVFGHVSQFVCGCSLGRISLLNDLGKLNELGSVSHCAIRAGNNALNSEHVMNASVCKQRSLEIFGATIVETLNQRFSLHIQIVRAWGSKGKYLRAV